MLHFTERLNSSKYKVCFREEMKAVSGCVFPRPTWRMEELCMFQDSRLRHKGQLHLIRRTALCCGAVDEL